MKRGLSGLLGRLAHDRSGNTIAMVAAAVVPLLAMVGGGIDMGRSYLSQSRLQQACDAGVLAARKKLGSATVTTGTVPTEVAEAGNRFFNLNFRSGAYGSENRDFQMTLENDYSISGVATVDVPTTVMGLFGYDDVDVQVECQAKLNFSNTDIMMVLDTTGSMAEKNDGDSESRIEVLRDVVAQFHTQIEATKTSGTRVRYGFLPYSTNVNVAHLLEDSWIDTSWHYQSRESIVTGNEVSTTTYERNWAWVSGTKSEWVIHDSYAATWHPPSGGGYTYIDENENVVVVPPGSGYYTCDTAAPAGDYTSNDELVLETTEPFAGPPAGTRTIQDRKRTRKGTAYWLSLSGSTCNVMKSIFNTYIETYQRVTDPIEREIRKWRYMQLPRTFTDWRGESNGCIEERDTYEINDYDSVNLDDALDLNLDLVPDGRDATRWKPARPWEIFNRSMRWDGTGSFTPAPAITTEEYVNPSWIGLASCPASARKLAEMSPSDVSTYLATLTPTGQTYHDIGMIWGGRLLSPTGLYAAENADVGANPTSRHLIFLTDGETAPLDMAYGAYGVEPLDRRRWQPSSSLSLTDVVEKRFTVACNEVKKRNITVWVIGFGTSLNPVMTECAGPGHFFEAEDSAQLNDVFSKIAAAMGDLRVSK